MALGMELLTDEPRQYKRNNVEAAMFQYSFHTRNGKTRYRGLLKHRMHAYSRCMWMNLRRMVIFQISTFQRSIFALFGPIREAFGSFKGFLERYSPAEPIAMFHSEWPHWSCWIQNMPLFKVGWFFMYYSCILCRYKGCLSRGCVISLWRTLICLYDFIRTGRPL